jgi:hypothetical protein
MVVMINISSSVICLEIMILLILVRFFLVIFLPVLSEWRSMCTVKESAQE